MLYRFPRSTEAIKSSKQKLFVKTRFLPSVEMTDILFLSSVRALGPKSVSRDWGTQSFFNNLQLGTPGIIPPLGDNLLIGLSAHMHHYRPGEFGAIHLARSPSAAPVVVDELVLMVFSIAARTSSAASIHPMWSSIIAPERISEPGFTLSMPAYLGAVP